nr:MAG TPA: hypothetical protein [Caudoviricetes sp.]
MKSKRHCFIQVAFIHVFDLNSIIFDFQISIKHFQNVPIS